MTEVDLTSFLVLAAMALTLNQTSLKPQDGEFTCGGPVDGRA